MRNCATEEQIADMLNYAMEKEELPLLINSTEKVLKIISDMAFSQKYAELYEMLQHEEGLVEAWGNFFELNIKKEYQKVFTLAVFWAAI